VNLNRGRLLLVAGLSVFVMAVIYKTSSPTGSQSTLENPSKEPSIQADTQTQPEPMNSNLMAAEQNKEDQEEPSAEDIQFGAPGEDPEPQYDPVDGLQEEHRSLAMGALNFPDMKSLDPDDPSYDPRLEAQQTFAPMEADLLAADPLDSVAWREALERHKLRNLSVTKRAQFLRQSDQPEAAEELVLEWGKIYGTWQARAYGRAGPPGYKSPER
jgi:hypothetical protein